MQTIARLAFLLTLLACFCARFATAADPPAVHDLRMNQVQVIGTHNSYHVREEPLTSPRGRTLNYTHPPLDVQLDRGVRSFELDLYVRKGNFEVFHIPIIDEGTTFRQLTDGLATVRKWSEAHPDHVPISFLFELKRNGAQLDSSLEDVNAAVLDKLDEVLRSSFAEGQILTPDDVRGEASTLRDAVTGRGWPTLDEARGKVFFILHDQGAQRAAYTKGHPSLEARVMFVRSDESRDDAATLVMDGPNDPDIPRLAKAGYYIRTRADSSLEVESPRQPARRDAAFASGAHIISTDFPTGEKDADTGYLVEFPGQAPARVNPVNGPEALRGQTLQE
ncbi:MAG: hypothetical protein DWQ37_19750 [Planctomycetota bacterium]|nr:MAG: hypothetical protein DWQ37_19750 [Planctomycetota bacterium]